MKRIAQLLLVLFSNDIAAEIEIFPINSTCRHLIENFGYDEKSEVENGVLYVKKTDQSPEGKSIIGYRCKDDDLRHFLSVEEIFERDFALERYINLHSKLVNFYGAESPTETQKWEQVFSDDKEFISGYSRHWGEAFDGMSLTMTKRGNSYVIKYSINDRF